MSISYYYTERVLRVNTQIAYSGHIVCVPLSIIIFFFRYCVLARLFHSGPSGESMPADLLECKMEGSALFAVA